MAIFYLVRHGKPDYSGLPERGFFGFGRAFAPLSEEGIRQAEEAARDPRLQGAELIVSSPYTRALQTAQIISRHTGLPVTVELDLHEWVADWSNRYATPEEADTLAVEFARCRGVYPAGETRCWETLEHMRARVRRVADKYAGYGTVILVGHAMALKTLTHVEKLRTGEIVECRYEAGQPETPYPFRSVSAEDLSEAVK